MFSVVVEPTWIWVTFLEPQIGWLSAENAQISWIHCYSLCGRNPYICSRPAAAHTQSASYAIQLQQHRV